MHASPDRPRRRGERDCPDRSQRQGLLAVAVSAQPFVDSHPGRHGGRCVRDVHRRQGARAHGAIATQSLVRGSEGDEGLEVRFKIGRRDLLGILVGDEQLAWRQRTRLDPSNVIRDRLHRLTDGGIAAGS